MGGQMEAATHAIGWLELDGVVNMRDVGGIPTHDGGVIAAGRLIRSDNLQTLSARDVRRLVDDLGVTDVVDLRSLAELGHEGPGPLVGHPCVRISHFSMYAADAEESGVPAGERELPWVELQRAERADPEFVPVTADHDAHWSRHYLGYLAQRPDSVLGALRAIAAAPGAVIVHCAAGKDRTGTVTSLALSVAGARREAVLADFAASSERVEQILARLLDRPAYAAALQGQTAEQQRTRPETMARLLDTLDREHGGVLGWLAGHGWTGSDTERLVAKLR